MGGRRRYRCSDGRRCEWCYPNIEAAIKKVERRRGKAMCGFKNVQAEIEAEEDETTNRAKSVCSGVDNPTA